jgi:hypothetical protein
LFFILGFVRSDIFYKEKKPEHDNFLNQKIKKIFIIDDEPEKKN